MPTSAGSDAIEFGQMVRQKRKALGWSQEALAAEAFSNSTRKGRISQIENGKVPNITRDTVKLVARALGIDHEKIPLALRWPEAAEVGRDTNTLVNDIKWQVDELVSAKRDISREFGIKEGMLIALARRYAEGSPGDFDAALAGLERALQVAHHEREQGRLPSNVSNAIDTVIRRINTLNENGELEAGQAALDAEIDVLNKEDQLLQAARARLYDKGIAQAILTRSIDNGCRFLVAKCDLDNPRDWYSSFQSTFDEWHRRGASKGLNFDLEVAIALSREGISRATNSTHTRGMQIALATALLELGERESGTANLEAAISAYQAALKQDVQDFTPLDWAKTQIGLGTTLWRIGERESGTVRLEEAVTIFREAIQKISRDSLPLEWAAAQNGLGNALSTIGWIDDSEHGTRYLKESIVAYKLSLEERRQDLVPLEWAAAQNNLGTAHWALGERESGTTQLLKAVKSFRRALKEYTRARVPLDWAMVQNNLGVVLKSLGTREGSLTRLEEAVAACRAALAERAADRVPLDWAQSVGNEGVALRCMAEQSRDRILAEQALERITTACSVFKNVSHSPYTAYYATQVELARVLLTKLH